MYHGFNSNGLPTSILAATKQLDNKINHILFKIWLPHTKGKEVV